MHIVFESPRLLLRQFTEEDAPLIFQLNSDPEVIKYVHELLLTSEDQARKIIVDVIMPQYKNNLGRWAIHLKENNQFLGWCGLKYRPELDETDLGYRLKKSTWGKGYATEAAKHTLDHGLNKLNLPVITAHAHVENIGSIKVLEKIGMHFTREEILDNCPVKTYTTPKQQP